MELWFTRWNGGFGDILPLITVLLLYFTNNIAVTSPAGLAHGCDHGADGRICYFLLNTPQNQSEAEDACTSRDVTSHLAAITGGSAMLHVTYLMTSRHVTEAWIGGKFDLQDKGQASQNKNSAECGHMEITASKTATWTTIPCSSGRRFQCLYVPKDSSHGSCRYHFSKCGKYCVRHVDDMFHAPKVDWYKAARYCLSIHAELPSIDTLADAESWVRDSQLCNYTQRAQIEVLNSWTNYTNLRWHWTTGEDMHYTDWVPGSPVTQDGRCVKMAIGTHLDNGFKTENCSTKIPAICQKSMSNQPNYADLTWVQQGYHQHHHQHSHHHHPHRRSSEQPEPSHTNRPKNQRPRPIPTPNNPHHQPMRTSQKPQVPMSSSARPTVSTMRYSEPPKGRMPTTTTPDWEDGDHNEGDNGEDEGDYENSKEGEGNGHDSSTTKQTEFPAPMQWTNAMVIGGVVGGLLVLLIVILLGVVLLCCYRRQLLGCKSDGSDNHNQENTPVRPSQRINQHNDSNYSSFIDSNQHQQQQDQQLYYTELSQGVSRRENNRGSQSSSHQYTKLQDQVTETQRGNQQDGRYYEINPSGLMHSGSGRYVGSEQRGFHNQHGQNAPGASSYHQRELPEIPAAANISPTENQCYYYDNSGMVVSDNDHVYSPNNANNVTPGASRQTANDDQWEYLEVIAPPNEERPLRQPSSASQRSQDSGIDMK